MTDVVNQAPDFQSFLREETIEFFQPLSTTIETSLNDALTKILKEFRSDYLKDIGPLQIGSGEVQSDRRNIVGLPQGPESNRDTILSKQKLKNVRQNTTDARTSLRQKFFEISSNIQVNWTRRGQGMPTV